MSKKNERIFEVNLPDGDDLRLKIEIEPQQTALGRRWFASLYRAKHESDRRRPYARDLADKIAALGYERAQAIIADPKGMGCVDEFADLVRAMRAAARESVIVEWEKVADKGFGSTRPTAAPALDWSLAEIAEILLDGLDLSRIESEVLNDLVASGRVFVQIGSSSIARDEAERVEP